MPKNNSKANRERRQADAVSRQKQYDSLSANEKIDMLDSEGHAAKRERARLEKQDR